ncbi:hypothetical protein [Alphaproteobacteria bacterium endosymbiont of Tiliacea citrago]|uniref:hypothetical protein n=1 Tax=Alphaproteobacteria bacterium endosymbiont of Tiliacea citrago TaxID=3077944 RepID=UPI00313E021A
MKKSLYLIFSFFSSLNTRQENLKTFECQNTNISDEEILFNLLILCSESNDKENKIFDKFIKERPYALERLTKLFIAVALSAFQVKLQQIPDSIILKLEVLPYFCGISLLQDFIWLGSMYSEKNIKSTIEKNQQLLKKPEKHKQILTKLFQGDLTQLKFMCSDEISEKYSNSPVFKKLLSDLQPYSSILIESIVLYSIPDPLKLNNEKIEAICRLLNKKFKNKLHEKFLKLNESLELLKKEILKENFTNTDNFFKLLQIEIIQSLDKKLKKFEKEEKKDIYSLSTDEKKAIIKDALEILRITIEEVQPENIKKLIEKIRKAQNIN